MLKNYNRKAWRHAASLSAVAIAMMAAFALISQLTAPDAAVGLAKPASHDNSWRTGHATFAKGNDASCAACHDRSYCNSCHYSDNPKEAYHKTNYAYTHSLDKFLDERDCASCHETQTFCVTCHETNANVSTGGRPATHSQLGWSTSGHAEVAGSELDTCVACHDVAGADPVCMRCHRTGISPHGDNPVINMSSGPWQNDPGYVCFQCHSQNDSRLQ